jgi:hypothetical protein
MADVSDIEDGLAFNLELDRRQHKRPPAPSLRPRPRAIRHPAPHAASPLEPQAQQEHVEAAPVRVHAHAHRAHARRHELRVRGATAIDTPPSMSATISSEMTDSTLTNRSVPKARASELGGC